MGSDLQKRVILFFSALLIILIVVVNFVPEMDVRQSPQTNLAPFDASVTVGDNNPPTILSYYPEGLSFNAGGEDELYFSSSFSDLDGDELTASWIVDSNVVQEGIKSNFDEFNFTFGCGIGGDRNVILEVNDTRDVSRVTWNVNVQNIECSSGDGGGGGDGDGDLGDEIINFTVSRGSVEKTLSQGESSRETFLVENKGDLSVLFKTSLEGDGLISLLSLSIDNFTLNSGEKQLVDVNFDVPVNQKAGVYLGNVVVQGGSLKVLMGVILEVLDKGALFDLNLELGESVLTEKDKLVVKVDFQDISGLGQADVLFEYIIKDFDGNEIKISEETITVNGDGSIEREFDIPSDLDFGNYAFYVRMTYGEKVAVSSAPFKYAPLNFWYLVVMALIIINIIILAIIILYKYYKKRKLNLSLE